MVYVVNDGLKIIACGSGDNDFLSSCIDVGHGLILRGVEAGALENNVNAELAPRAGVSVLLSVDLDFLAVNDDGIIGSGYGVLALADLAAEGALSGIVLKKVSEHLRAGKVVDSNYFVALCVKHLTESKTTDTTETVNGNFN